MLKSELLRKERGMEHADYMWTAPDGTELYGQTWFSAEVPKGIINIIHGLGSHSSRYASWAEKFALKGFTVRSFDLRGNGRSQGKRGHSSSLASLLDDIELFLEKRKEEFPDIPFYLYGHSMGGNLVLNYAILQNQNYNGIITTSPWLHLKNKPSKLALAFAFFLNKIAPLIQIKNGLKAEDISRDLRAVHNYRTDPLNHDKISVRLFSEIYRAGINASLCMYKINVPLLIMHGSADNITSCKASRNFVRNASSKTTFIEWENAFHELHHDDCKEEVFKSLLDWLTKQNRRNPQ